MDIKQLKTRRAALVAGAVVALGTAGSAVATDALATPAARPAAATARAPSPSPSPSVGLQHDLRRILRVDDVPGALASVRSADGDVRNLVAGVGDRKTGERPPVDAEVRIGSNTKPFTSVVMLQLVDEGKVDLDAPVDRYLPGLLRGAGIDGRAISVRQLLGQRSGLPNYTTPILKDGLLPHLHDYISPRSALDLALAQPADFAPGAKWEYSNTNYLVAGLVIEAVTERPVGDEITRRIVRPLHLRHTYFPHAGEERFRGVAVHGYHHDDPDGPFVDVTTQDPSFGWAAGAMVSTPSEVNRFFTALLGGELLPPELLREMKTTSPAPEFGADAGYGLGLISSRLSCGGVAWGHGGTIGGYQTTNAATDDGRAVTIATTALPREQAQVDRLDAAVDRALCAAD